MPDLPEEVIGAELLTRLPVKDLLRFRVVSKRWCALIDGEKFVKSHLKLSLINKKLILEGTTTSTLHFLNVLDVAEENSTILLDMPFEGLRLTWLLGSCNGLLLLEFRVNKFFLLNPSTNKFVNLPDCPDCDGDGDRYCPEKESHGLGYDLINDDYKVVRIVDFRNEGGEWVASETRVYSLKSNSWRKIQDFPCLLPDCPIWAAFVGGALHIVTVLEKIVGFDISQEDYYFVPLPDSFDENFGSLHVRDLGSCLCLLGGYDLHRTDVWVMQEYRVKESWTKLFTIAPPTVDRYMSVVPLVYSSDGSEVLLNYDNNSLIWYDLKSGTVRDARVQNLPQNFHAYVFVESLVPLSGFDVMKKQLGQVEMQEKEDSKKRKFMPDE